MMDDFIKIEMEDFTHEQLNEVIRIAKDRLENETKIICLILGESFKEEQRFFFPDTEEGMKALKDCCISKMKSLKDVSTFRFRSIRRIATKDEALNLLQETEDLLKG